MLSDFIQDLYGNPIASETVKFIESFGLDVYNWTLVLGILLLGTELLNSTFTRRLKKVRLLETGSNILTQVPYYFSELLVFGLIVSNVYFQIYNVIPWKIPDSIGIAILVIVLADLTYYVEHFSLHKVRLLWTAHSVHHSSTIMNTSTAFRFSFLDPIFSGLFHLPLVLMGFNPIFIFVGEILVQAYQFWIHNEMVGRLGPLEHVLNTPAAHRVHHGTERKYIDKNFGGILIIWDRIFGTYQQEEELPTYGLTEQINTYNPVKIQIAEMIELGKDVRKAGTAKDKFKMFIKPPGWTPT